MRTLVVGLTVLLVFSLALNLYFYAELTLRDTKQPSNLISSPFYDDPPALDDLLAAEYRQGESAFQAKDASKAVLALQQLVKSAPEQAEALQLLWFQRILQLLEVNDHSYHEFVQEYLRHFPLDPYFLYLEIELQRGQNTAIDTLFSLYQLLQNPLPPELNTIVLKRIQTVYFELSARLKDIGAYDILASTIESLSPFMHDDPVLLFDLAEAYAAQSQWGLLDGVIANLPRNDERTIALEYQRNQALNRSDNEATQPIGEPSDLPPLYANDNTHHAPQQADKSSVPLQRKGQHFIVTAQVDDRFGVNLLIDTGASSTVLSDSVFATLSLDLSPEFIGEYPVNTANGQVIAPVYRFTKLTIGAHSVSDIAIVVLPLGQLEADGLLGMNFLRGFQFEIDQQKAQLNLTPIHK